MSLPDPHSHSDTSQPLQPLLIDSHVGLDRTTDKVTMSLKMYSTLCRQAEIKATVSLPSLPVNIKCVSVVQRDGAGLKGTTVGTCLFIPGSGTFHPQMSLF